MLAYTSGAGIGDTLVVLLVLQLSAGDCRYASRSFMISAGSFYDSQKGLRD